jgi:hypothetical protein
MAIRTRVLTALAALAVAVVGTAGTGAAAARGLAERGTAERGTAERGTGERGGPADAARAGAPGGRVLDYRRSRLTVTRHGVETRDGVLVRDISYAAAGAPAVRAYLVEPGAPGRPHARAGVLYLHWFAPGNPTSNRREFLDEAVELARHGTVSLLPDLTFPWAADPVGDRTDLDAVVAQAVQVRRGLDLLDDRRDVDAHRIGVAGHDYGGMYGLLVAAVDRRVHTAVAINVDATFGNWFLQFWLGFEGEAATAYQRLLEPVDPIRYVPSGPRGGSLFQFSVPDFFIPDSTARALFAAASHPKDQRLYPGAEHSLEDQQARADRTAWLTDRLDLPPAG